MTKDGLLFDWPGRHHLHLLLPATLLAAIAAHAGLFFLFSIIYPRPDAGAIDSRSVYIVLPGSEESARLSALLESSDPSVFAPGRGLPTGGEMAAVEYTPHYETAKPMVEEMPVTVPRPPRLPLSTGPVPGSSIHRSPIKASSVPTTTKLRADERLTPRLPELPQALKSLHPTEGTFPASATFLVAIRPEGTVAHVFPQQGSGSAEWDQRAADLVRSLRFLPGTEDPAWGILTLEWGGQ
jgi:hypothetical protein